MGELLVIGLVCGVLYVGTNAVVKGAKKVGHKVKHVVTVGIKHVKQEKAK